MRKMKKLLCVVLACMVGLLQPMQVKAAEADTLTFIVTETPTLDLADEGVYGGLYDVEGNPYQRDPELIKCTIRMSYGTNPDCLYMEFITASNVTASEIGIKDVKVQQKVGIFWNTIASGSGAYVTDDDIIVASSTCSSVVKGETYRVSCTHYGYLNGVYHSVVNTTDGYKFG